MSAGAVFRSDGDAGAAPFAGVEPLPPLSEAPQTGAGLETEGAVAPGAGSDVTVVLATLNEARNLPRLLWEIDHYLSPKPEIVIVDDGSTDGTREYIELLASSTPRVHPVFNVEPQTLTRAHAQGLAIAKTPFVVVMDADCQHPASAIPGLLDTLRSGYDVAVASRYVHGGSVGDRPPIRGLVSRVAGALAWTVVPGVRGLADPLSGFYAARRHALLRLQGVPRGFESLVFVLAGAVRLRVAEVPYCMRSREEGESKILRGGAFLRIFLGSLLAARRRSFSPSLHPATLISNKPQGEHSTTTSAGCPPDPSPVASS